MIFFSIDKILSKGLNNFICSKTSIYMRLILLYVYNECHPEVTISNHRLPKDLHRRIRMLSMYVSCYRPHGIIVIVANAVEYLVASQPGLRLCLHFHRRLCGQERQYSSKWQLLSCIVKNRIWHQLASSHDTIWQSRFRG